MAESDFRLPGFETALASPEAYVSGVLRSFAAASQALGAATDRLVVRIAEPRNRRDPDYQIQTVDAEDAAPFSGETHNFLNDDITIRIDESELQDQAYTAEQVKDWLNVLSGEAVGGEAGGGILSDRWREADASDPRD